MAYNKIIYNGSTLIDLTGDTVTEGDLLSGKTAHGADGEAISGSMANRGAVSGTIGTLSDSYTIQAGYHNGSGSVEISSTEKAKIIPGNIKKGTMILGVTGDYEIALQAKTVTPSGSQQSISPDSGYGGLSGVTVYAIPYSETSNPAGGITVTIGTQGV